MAVIGPYELKNLKQSSADVNKKWCVKLHVILYNIKYQ